MLDGCSSVMPHRRRLRIFVEVTGLMIALSLGVAALTLWRDGLSSAGIVLVLSGTVCFLFNIVNVVSVPEISGKTLRIRYLRCARVIHPETIIRIRYSAVTRRYYIRRRFRPIPYHFTASAYINGAEVDHAFRAWAKEHGIEVE